MGRRHKQFSRFVITNKGNDLALLLWDKQRGICHYCCEPMEWDSETDRRRSFDVFNLVLACRRCNSDKGDMTEAEFAAFKAQHGRHPTAHERLAMAIADGRAVVRSPLPALVKEGG